jgi:16S rRNA (uracil1498-N3)-methyltransferase
MLVPDAPESLASACAAVGAGGGRLASVQLLVGPEGGLSGREVLLAQRAGYVACRLGPRVLRTETAPLAALAVLQALAGDLAR